MLWKDNYCSRNVSHFTDFIMWVEKIESHGHILTADMTAVLKCKGPCSNIGHIR